MLRRVAQILRTLGKWYIHSWVFLLWGAFCAAAGAAFYHMTLTAYLVATGVL